MAILGHAASAEDGSGFGWVLHNSTTEVHNGTLHTSH